MPHVAPIIDCHTHAVSADLTNYPQRDLNLANGAWWDGLDASADNLVAAADSHVDGIVLVQAAGVYGDDNRYLVDAIASPLFTGVAIMDPTLDHAADQLRAIAPAIDGIRVFHIPTPAEPWLVTEQTADLIDLAADLGLTVTVCCTADSLPLLGEQLERRADLPVVLDHCGFADFSGGAPFAEAQPLWDLADHANLHLKFTPTLVRLNNADPHALVEHLVANFGAERIVWGSDWPQHRETNTYGEQVELIASWLSGLDEQAKTDILGRNALRLWPGSWPHLQETTS